VVIPRSVGCRTPGRFLEKAKRSDLRKDCRHTCHKLMQGLRKSRGDPSPKQHDRKGRKKRRRRAPLLEGARLRHRRKIEKQPPPPKTPQHIQNGVHQQEVGASTKSGKTRRGRFFGGRKKSGKRRSILKLQRGGQGSGKRIGYEKNRCPAQLEKKLIEGSNRAPDARPRSTSRTIGEPRNRWIIQRSASTAGRESSQKRSVPPPGNRPGRVMKGTFRTWPGAETGKSGLEASRMKKEEPLKTRSDSKSTGQRQGEEIRRLESFDQKGGSGLRRAQGRKRTGSGRGTRRFCR